MKSLRSAGLRAMSEKVLVPKDQPPMDSSILASEPWALIDSRISLYRRMSSHSYGATSYALKHTPQSWPLGLGSGVHSLSL